MRTFLKAIVLALAVVFTVSTGTAFAADKADKTEWKKVAVQDVPLKVMTRYRRLFSHSKITKAEKAGAGVNTEYRLTILRQGKGKKQPQTVVFDAQGHAR